MPAPTSHSSAEPSADPLLVNDIHSRLNPTRVSAIHRPRDADELLKTVRDLIARKQPFATAGGRHAMGAQQFASDAPLLDVQNVVGLIDFDNNKGLATFGAGATWPDIVKAINAQSPAWAIRQKQTGADNLTLGGAVSANVHGRGLLMGPIVDDIERLTAITPAGELVTCSRTENRDLFTFIVGGYGLFGVVVSVTLRLAPRQKLRRLVDVLDVDDALQAVRRRVRQGCIYGDFQYAIDSSDEHAFLLRGVFASYIDAGPNAPEPDASADLKPQDWGSLLALAHSDKRKAFSLYAQHYLATHGNVYWSDSMQLSTYIPSYDQFLGDNGKYSLMIGEICVPPEHLPTFLEASRRILRGHKAEDIYGTIRAIQPDRTTFLAWAKRDYACVIFNLRTAHTDEGVRDTAATFRALHTAALDLNGSFYLTYHRYATRDQIDTAYPQFARFLQLKKLLDPQELLTSNWYRHYRQMYFGQ